MISNVARRVLSTGEAIEFSTLVGEPKRKVTVLARRMAGVEDAVVLEADRFDQPLPAADASSEALFLDLAKSAIMGAGSHFFDESGQTGDVDLSVLLGYPRGHPSARFERLRELIHPDDFKTYLAHRSRYFSLTSVAKTRMRRAAPSEWRATTRSRSWMNRQSPSKWRILATSTPNWSSDIASSRLRWAR